MGMIARSCVVCGVRVKDGQSRCPRHRRARNARARACLTCGALTKTGNFCPEHTTTPDRSGQTWRDGYSDPSYAPARRVALRRAGYRCEDCGRRAGAWCEEHERPIRLNADHKVALSDGGPKKVTADDLVIRCQCCCHQAKTTDDGQQRRRRR